MIIIDGKEVNFNKIDGRYEPDAHKIIKEIAEMNLDKKPYVIKYPYAYDREDVHNPGIPYRKAQYGIPLTELVDDWLGDGIRRTITYCDKIIKDKKGNIQYALKNGNRVFNFKGNNGVFTKKDAELVWFLKNVSTYKGKAFIEENREEEAKMTANRRRKESAAARLIYEDMDIADIRTVSKSLQLQGVDDLEDDEVRNLLHSKVMADDQLYKEFVDNKRVDERVDNKAAIQTAKDKGILRLQIDGHKRSWMINLGNGEEELKKVKPGGSPDAVLYGYFEDNPEQIEELKKMIIKLS